MIPVIDFDKFTNIELKITKAICLETLKANINFKKKKPDKNEITGKSWIDNFKWKCFDSMDYRNQLIHLRRTQLLIQSGCKILPPEKTHDWFVGQRTMHGWQLGDEKIEYDLQGNWIGSDPMHQNIDDCPPGFYDYCLMRNDIATKIAKSGLKELL